MTEVANKKRESSQQEVCIDLPGETVKCWRSSDNIKVVLRKHRDVIFDLNLGKNKTYTVHATASDFYNARDKKLVQATRRDAVKFRDGERMHLWITRSFEGSLVLKCDGETLMTLTPNEVDKHQYDDSPTTKPSPIIIVLGTAHPTKPAPTTPLTRKPMQVGESTPSPSAAPIDEDFPVVCVVDGDVKGMPVALAEHIKRGGGKPVLADLDPFDVATRNWIWGQVAGVAAYAADNWDWIRASLDSKTSRGFRLVSAKIHMVRGRVRFYFSGYSKLNFMFGPGGFGPAHERIVSIFAGFGSTDSTFRAVTKGVVGTFAKCSLVSLVFSGATAYAEWTDDVQKDRYDLAAALFMTVLKAIVAAALTVLIVAIIVMVVLGAAGASMPVIVVGALTVGGSLGFNYLLDAADKSYGPRFSDEESNANGLAAAIAPLLRKAGEEIQESWAHLMKKFPRDYQELTF